jgi:hypothetical protein
MQRKMLKMSVLYFNGIDITLNASFEFGEMFFDRNYNVLFELHVK